MIRIYKYALKKGGNVDAKEADERIYGRIVDVLHAGLDTYGTLCIWALVATGPPEEAEVVNKTIHVMVRGTGHDCTDVKNAIHVGTVNQGPYMWHVFVEWE